jgi:hypothetical protein
LSIDHLTIKVPPVVSDLPQKYAWTPGLPQISQAEEGWFPSY